MKWSQVIEAVPTLIGSGLAVTAITALFTIINQPELDLQVIPHRISIDRETGFRQPSELDHFEVIVKNTGRAPANDLKLSMFFFGEVEYVKPIVYGENITLREENVSIPKASNTPSPSYNVPTVITTSIKRLAPNALVNIYVEVSEINTKDGFPADPPYYVSATFNGGSEDTASLDPSYLRYLIGSEVEGFYPGIPYGEPDISLNQKILIIASISSIVFFVIALRRFRISNINKLRLKDFSQNVRAEILSIIEILQGRLGQGPPQQHPLPSVIWDSLSDEELKRIVFNNEIDYSRINKLYEAITTRNSSC